MTLKPKQSTERTLIFAKIESAKGTDALPTKTADAFLVGDADITLDVTVLERNLYSPSMSPSPGQAGRKVVNVSFSHELKGSGANGVRPKLGTLLRGCAMLERLITAGASTQIDTPLDEGSIVGPVVTWAKTAAPTSHYGSYIVECVLGGASATAKLQVSKWEQGEYDATVGNNRRLEARQNFSNLTTLTLDSSDLTAPEFTVGGTYTVGDVLYAIVHGEIFRVTVTQAMTDLDGVATALAALIDADARFTASAVGAVVTVGFASGSAPVTVTSATTAVALGASGATITPTWTGNLVVGQKWLVVLHEVGYLYTPVSDADEMESLTIYFFKDGNLHIITGAQGTVTFTGEAGNYGSAQFEFTGGFTEPVPETLPTGVVYEQSKPPQVELAQMSIHGDKDFCAQSFTITLANTVTPRDCMNGEEGLNGSNITDRAPTVQLNPESAIDVYTDMWGQFADGEVVPIHLRVGSVNNNIVRFFMGRASYTGLNYGDRNGTLTLEPAWQLNAVSGDGDDELRVYFPQHA